ANRVNSQEGILGELREILQGYLTQQSLEVQPDKLNLFLILGVNGVGKTTTIAKLAYYYQQQGVQGIAMSAGDTFRAGAIDQLKIHGERTSCRVVSQQPGADPGAVIYDTIESAQNKGESLILADTAGRMHTKKNLVKELEKVDKVVSRRMGQGIYKKILVIDSTTGQNGLHQAEVFHEAVGVDGLILTKYDSTARGGLLLAISRKLKLPIFFIGRGEGLDHLDAFDTQSYLDDLLSLQ
ncbi:MAG: signal recognition particle-docking protein FtsY, partial [Spirochaetaceae bacterium]|nr:signal recognition particle-docking protein FtsY [Spirochaetaceae bacterium]